MNKTVMRGCGIGCGLVALVVLMLVGGGAWFAREMGREYKTVQETEQVLAETQGEPGSWVPPAGLVPTEDRLAVFVGVREAAADWRARLQADMDRFRAERERGGLAGTWNSIRAGSDLGLSFAGFWSARNRLLAEQGMGLDEYVWFYGLAYYAWLGHDPGAGAQPFDFGRGAGVQIEVGGKDEDPATRLRRRAHDDLGAILERAVPGDIGASAEDLAAERARLAADPLAAPWQGTLPAAVAEALEPWRERIAAAWSEDLNPLECMHGLDGDGQGGTHD